MERAEKGSSGPSRIFITRGLGGVGRMTLGAG
jgi:hypothetical protein